MVVSETVRISPNSIDPAIKNYHWLDLVKGLYDAYEGGGETALVLDSNGNMAEGPGFNVFTVKGGKLATPAYGVLPGITGRSVFDISDEIGLTYEATDVSRQFLVEADEVFITSTAGGIMPVTQVDGIRIGDGTVGPITRQLTDLYWQKHTDPDWSTAVDYHRVSKG